MTRRLSVDEAMGLLEGELGSGQRSLDDLVAKYLWLAFLRFGRRSFDILDTPDADGLLFQYGNYAFDGPPAFTLDLTRQFAISDGYGDHDHYVQVHCELRYGLAPSLEALGSFDSWFFHAAEDDFEEWAQGLTERAAWATIHRLKPTELRVYQERV
ncbi:hypothetical protein [Streptomyces clavifer]|uniref:hypothetical protein n=1 Tax=Streptomyces clavifer TaxID=68188 RepID=UPI003088CA60|nr:hypothetical protein OG388_00965 [Streptomyces clavifer]WRY86408.1 hypothetical protein OG388_37025 [Streptomyces clavifer]